MGQPAKSCWDKEGVAVAFGAFFLAPLLTITLRLLADNCFAQGKGNRPQEAQGGHKKHKKGQ
jgi:hypothetical protein